VGKNLPEAKVYDTLCSWVAFECLYSCPVTVTVFHKYPLIYKNVTYILTKVWFVQREAWWKWVVSLVTSCKSNFVTCVLKLKCTYHLNIWRSPGKPAKKSSVPFFQFGLMMNEERLTREIKTTIKESSSLVWLDRFLGAGVISCSVSARARLKSGKVMSACTLMQTRCTLCPVGI